MERDSFPVLYPTKEEFSKPFVEYVQDVFRQYPGLPCFKVIPPKGYSTSKKGLPKFQDVVINTPIKQYVRPTLSFLLMLLS